MLETRLTKAIKSIKDLEAKVKADKSDVIVGTIQELKKLGLDQYSQVLGISIRPDQEHVELKNFKTRELLDEYVIDLLGDNLIINRRNRHRLVGKRKDTDRLMLSDTSTVYGLKVILLPV